MYWVLISAFLFLSSVAVADEVACSGSTGSPFFDSATREEIDVATATDVRVISDKFVALYVSPQYRKTYSLWEGGRDMESVRPFAVTKEIGSDTKHIETLYRQSYAVTEAYGETGYFVVAEYGIRTTEFDVIHSQIWKPTDDGWRVIALHNVFRCPPNSSLVEL